MEGRSQTFCHTNCDLANTMPLCQTNADCPFIKVPGPDNKEVSVRMKCISEPATPEVPKWTKYCQYHGP